MVCGHHRSHCVDKVDGAHRAHGFHGANGTFEAHWGLMGTVGLMGTLGPMWTMGLFGLWGLRAHGLHAYEDAVVHGFVAASVCILIVLVILWGSIRFGG